MGGRNGGAIGRSKRDTEEAAKKNKVVTMPRRDGGEAAEETEKGGTKAAGRKPKNGSAKEGKPEKSKKTAAKKIEKKEFKGAKKALRHAVKKVVKQGCGKLAGTLMDKVEQGDLHSAEMLLVLMEKKKKKGGGGDDGHDGPSLAEQLMAGPGILEGRSAAIAIAGELLVVRSRNGRPEKLRANAVQMEFEKNRGLIQEHKLDLKQIGYRRQIRANFRGLVRQEYAEDAESCFLTSGESVFELAAVEARMKTAPEPVERRKNGELEIWLPPVKGKQYVVAVDPAGGGSEGDYSAAQVLEMETGLQCAEFAGHMGGLELAQFVTDMAREYNGAWLVVERNNHGSGVLALAETACKYGRIYRQSAQAGWLTTSVSRPAMLGQLNAALVEEPDRFQSRRLLGECRSFVRMTNGSSGALAGTHDDRVMAMAMGLAARAELVGKRQRG